MKKSLDTETLREITRVTLGHHNDHAASFEHMGSGR
jgi:hypothetical protein